MKTYLEETIILVSIGWMVIYLYGLNQLDSAAYDHWLLLIPVLLVLLLIFIAINKKNKGRQ